MEAKKAENRWLHYGIWVIIYAVVLAGFGSHTILHIYHASSHQSHSSQSSLASDCTLGHTIIVNIQRGRFEPAIVQAKRCDKLEIVNQDNQVHEPAFGEHEHHLHYLGFQERVLRPQERNSFLLLERGQFDLHDHINEAIRGRLVVY
ncbi:MAG TPA: cupredoxin domain-containing protein [Candidatus Saccharimonadales bacterium]|nr:cupredoxin domain-containing protein [Candidatus Saccharimonadales bacterium]